MALLGQAVGSGLGMMAGTLDWQRQREQMHYEALRREADLYQQLPAFAVSTNSAGADKPTPSDTLNVNEKLILLLLED